LTNNFVCSLNQDSTTGNLMWVFVQYFFVALLFMATVANIIYLFTIRNIINKYPDLIDMITRSQFSIEEKIDDLGDDNDRHFLALKEQLNETLPKITEVPKAANNWESVRAAFKGPTKVDLNERN